MSASLFKPKKLLSPRDLTGKTMKRKSKLFVDQKNMNVQSILLAKVTQGFFG